MYFFTISMGFLWFAVALNCFLKTKNITKINTILLYSSLAALLPIISYTLSSGQVSNANMGVSLFMKNWITFIDPLSAIFMLILVFYLALSKSFYDDSAGFKDIRKNFILKIFLIGSLLISFTSYDILSFYIGWIFAGIAANLLVKDKFMLRQTLISTFFISLATIVISTLAGKEPLVAESQKMAAFLMYIIGFAIFLFPMRKLFEEFKENMHNIKFTYALFSILSIYGIYRFVSVTSIYQKGCLYLLTGIAYMLITISVVYLMKSKLQFTNFKLCMNNILLGFSIVSIILGALGKTVTIPLITILGLLSGLAFFILNLISNNILLNCSSDNKDELNKFLTILIPNYIGIPLSFGFLAGILYIGMLVSGMLSNVLSIKIFFAVLMLISVIIYILYLTALIKITKKVCAGGEITLKNHPLRLFFTGKGLSTILLIILGLLPIVTIRYLAVPVSQLAGGTSLYTVFDAIFYLAQYLTVFYGVFLLLLILYLGIKFVLKKYVFANFQK